MSIFKKNTTPSSANEAPQQTEPEVSANTLLRQRLDEIGCHYEQEGSEFHVVYQGENLIVYGGEDTRFVLIRDLWWHSANADDLTAVSLIRRAINECNINGRATLIYSFNNEEHLMGVHSQIEIVFIKEVPELTNFLRYTFDTILHSHHFFYQTMETLRQEDYSKNN